MPVLASIFGKPTSMEVLCQEKTRVLGRAQESARCDDRDSFLRTSASRRVVPASHAEPDIHGSPLSRENASSLGALRRARVAMIGIRFCARAPHGGWSLHPMQNRTSICCLELRRAVTDD